MPADSPGKPEPVTRPKPNSSSAVHICCGCSDSAIFATPTLLDLASTVVTSIVPRLCLSFTVLMPTRIIPGPVSISVSGW